MKSLTIECQAHLKNWQKSKLIIMNTSIQDINQFQFFLKFASLSLLPMP